MRHSVRARPLLTFVCTAWALAVPAPALAAGGSPVHVDPSSPVAKEYALPLATARGAPPESGKPGKLFGSGLRHASSVPASTTTTPTAPPTEQQVTPVTPPAATTTPTSAAKPPVHRHPQHVTTVTLPTLTRPAPVKPLTAKATPAAYRVLEPGAGSGWLWMVAAAVAVLAIGSAGGLLLSRRR